MTRGAIAPLWLALASVLAAPAAFAREDDAPATPSDVVAEAKRSPRSSFDVELDALFFYTSNLFHEQNRRVDDFDNKSGDGERYEDMAGPGDFCARPGVEFVYTRKVGKVHRPELAIGAEYHAYKKNLLANYFLLHGKAAVELDRHDELTLEIDYVPSRFRKNYKVDRSGAEVFERAYYLEVEPSLAYRHDFTKRWSTTLEYKLGVRDYLEYSLGIPNYDDPFNHRDWVAHTLELAFGYRPTKRLELELGVRGGRTTTGVGPEFGVLVDRSHDDAEVLLGAELDLPHHWNVEAGAAYRLRRYTSDQPADDANYRRTDGRIHVSGTVEQEVSHHATLQGTVSYTTLKSDRIDPTIDPEEVGYTELVVGLGGEMQF